MFRHLFHVALLTLPLGAGVLAEENIGELLLQADEAVESGQSKQAVDLLTKAIAIRPNLASAYYTRGRERFRLGQLEKSVADFDSYVALAPDQESRQWERGIAYYYVGKFKQGAAQFELYQTYHDNDVENSVWRYLCMVPTTGIEEARSVMLPIKDDRRNPMMQVFNLYRGRLKPADVLAETRRGAPSADVLAGRQFYAHLYLGLYYEIAGDAKNARKYIDLAASPALKDSRKINRYMWDVARIHQQKLDQAKQRTAQPKPDAPERTK
ncbi:MAG: tetratricopeptide repeat protein [Pirellulaceae bacterium]|nr:tetratricopeptide repeat protein [Pirellulaceae bacterium]